MRKKGVIVIGGHVQALGICRIFGNESIPVVVIEDTMHNLARHSRFCVKFILYSKDQLLTKLMSSSLTTSYRDWLILPTNDHHVRILSQNKSMLEKYYRVGADSWDIVSVFYHKSLSYPFVKGLAIPIPQTAYFENYIEVDQLSKDLMYPVIIKPSIMIQFYKEFRTKAIICETREILLSSLREVLHKIEPKDLLIQEIIPGNPHNQYSVGLMSNEGEVIDRICVRRARQHPLDFGNATTFAHTIDLPVIETYAKSIIRESGYTGMAEVEFKYDVRDDKYKFLEVNPRTWKWHTLAKAAGCNMLLNYYYQVYGQKLLASTIINASWTHDLLDFFVRTQMKIKQIETVPTMGVNVHATFDAEDLGPALLELIYLPLNVIRRG